MFKEKRGYRAVFFRCPGLRRADDIALLLPPDVMSGVARREWSGVDIVHRHYLSRDNFTSLDDEVLPREGSRFIYDMYHAAFSGPDGVVLMIAFPFLRMGRDLFEKVRLAKRGHGIVFKTVDVPILFSRLCTNKLRSGPVRIAQAEMLHLGDIQVSKVVLCGTDVLNSDTYAALRGAFGAKRGLQPTRCQLTYQDEEDGGFFRVHVDSVGNFLFRVCAGASNLLVLPKLISFLHQATVVSETRANPLMRARADDDAVEME